MFTMMPSYYKTGLANESLRISCGEAGSLQLVLNANTIRTGFQQENLLVD